MEYNIWKAAQTERLESRGAARSQGFSNTGELARQKKTSRWGENKDEGRNEKKRDKIYLIRKHELPFSRNGPESPCLVVPAPPARPPL